MIAYILPMICGLFLGLTAHGAGLSSPEGMTRALALRRHSSTRAALTALGTAIAFMALLSWLAVMDVDRIVPGPLHPGVLMGAAVFGVSMALAGSSASSAWTAPCASRPVEGLCVLAGSLCAGAIIPLLPMDAVRAPVFTSATLFCVTLDEPFLLQGGFLGQGLAGVALALLGMCWPVHREEAEVPEIEAPLLLPAPEEPPEGDAEAFVALLPGEEPLVVDTLPEVSEDESAAPPEEAAPDDAADEADFDLEDLEDEEAAEASEPPEDTDINR